MNDINTLGLDDETSWKRFVEYIKRYIKMPKSAFTNR